MVTVHGRYGKQKCQSNIDLQGRRIILLRDNESGPCYSRHAQQKKPALSGGARTTAWRSRRLEQPPVKSRCPQKLFQPPPRHQGSKFRADSQVTTDLECVLVIKHSIDHHRDPRSASQPYLLFFLLLFHEEAVVRWPPGIW